MLITNGRGKQYETETMKWSVYVHDMAYEEGDYAYQVENALRSLRKSEQQDFVSLFRENLKSERTIDALYNTAIAIIERRK